MTTPTQFSVPDTDVLMNQVFPEINDTRIFVAIHGWQDPVTYFVGRNGTGKSRAAKIIAQRTNARFLAPIDWQA
jgi:phage replication-related protein YjqB (UPF0714/DUF867 family)